MAPIPSAPGETLDAVEAALATKRRAEAELLLLAAAWADQHPGDVIGRFGYTPRGGEQALRIGGEGTPTVAEFSHAELAISLEVHPLAARSLMADALDLRHRLPETWRLVTEELALPDWVARRIARATRALPAGQAAEIDDRVAGEAAELPTARLLTVVEALVLAATTEETDGDRRRRLDQRFVAISDGGRGTGRDAERRLPTIYGSLAEEDALRLEDTLRRLAAAIEGDDDEPLGARRSRALGLLANPARAQHLLDGGSLDDETGRRLAPPVTLYLHVTDTAFTRDADGVARFEQGRPLTLAHAREVLGHGNVTIRPVLDLEGLRPADAYEFTGSLREGLRLRTPADCYPYAVRVGRSLPIDLDVDHTDAWDTDGPPGQTADGNGGPMTRHHHRIKTHGPMSVRQPLPGLYVWRTPGRRYLATDHRGTRRIDPALGDDVFSDSALFSRLASLLLDER